MGFPPQGEMGIFCISPVPREHSANFMGTYYALGIVLGVEELLGKYRSDMGSVPM